MINQYLVKLTFSKRVGFALMIATSGVVLLLEDWWHSEGPGVSPSFSLSLESEYAVIDERLFNLVLCRRPRNKQVIDGALREK